MNFALYNSILTIGLQLNDRIIDNFEMKYLKYKNKYLVLKRGKAIECQHDSSINCDKKHKNATILFITESDHILLVRDIKNKKWMLPGGKIEKNECCFDAAKREFKEESSFILDETKILSKKNYIYNKTIIYIIKSSQRLPVFDIVKTNGETDMVEYKKIEDIKEYLKNPMVITDAIIKNIKFYNQESFRELINKNML